MKGFEPIVGPIGPAQVMLWDIARWFLLLSVWARPMKQRKSIKSFVRKVIEFLANLSALVHVTSEEQPLHC